MQSGDELITMTDAANLAPNRPCSSTVWRWCRKGVKARNGQQIRLQHVRMGGQVFTSRNRLDAFGAQLAEADAAYFEQQASLAGSTMPVRTRAQPASEREAAIEEAERFFKEAGR